MKSTGHKLEALRCAIKVATEGYRLVRTEYKGADIFASHGPDNLPQSVAIEVQMRARHALANVYRDLGNGCSMVINIAPDEPVKARILRQLDKLDPDLRSQVLVLSTQEFHETPLFKLVNADIM